MNISTIHNVICVGILSWQKLQPDSEVKGPLHVPMMFLPILSQDHPSLQSSLGALGYRPCIIVL